MTKGEILMKKVYNTNEKDKKYITYRSCRNHHFKYWQGICMAERFSCRWFSIAVNEEYCNACGKIRRKYILFISKK